MTDSFFDLIQFIYIENVKKKQTKGGILLLAIAVDQQLNYSTPPLMFKVTVRCIVLNLYFIYTSEKWCPGLRLLSSPFITFIFLLDFFLISGTFCIFFLSQIALSSYGFWQNPIELLSMTR